MKNMIENLINGNVTIARGQAKGKSMAKILRYCVDELGWSWERAGKTAYFLKTGEGWQEYCDAR